MLLARALPRPGVTAVLLAILLAIVPRALIAQITLLAYYPFDGNAQDMSGNGHHGTVRGAVLTTDRFGAANRAYYFRGASIVIPHSPELALGRGSVYTISAWIRTCRSQPTYAGIVVKGPTSIRYPGYQLVMISDRVGMQAGTEDGDFFEDTGRTYLCDGMWHLVTMIVDHPAERVRLFVDGVLESTTSTIAMNTALRQENPVYIGVERNQVRWFDGAIDDVSIMSGALDAASILEMYREGGWTVDVARGRRYSLSICSGRNTTLTAPGEFPEYRWSTGATTRSISVSRPGRYTVQSIDQVGCGPVDTFDVSTNAGPRLQLTRAVSICEGDTVEIGATAEGGLPPVTYRWSPAEGLSDTTIATPRAAPRRRTVYRLVVTDESGCTIVDSVGVEVLPGPSIAAPDTVSTCNGASVVLPVGISGIGTLRVQWSPATGLDDPRSATPTARPATTTTYVVVVTDGNGCSSSDTLTVMVGSATTLDAGPDVEICQGQEIVIGGNVVGGSEPVMYSWLPADGLSSPTVSRPTLRATVSRTYYVYAVDARGCRSIDSVRVTVREAPQVDGGDDRTICTGDTVSIGIAQSGGVSYRWVAPDGQEIGRGPVSVVSPSSSTRYVLEVTGPNGCVGRDTVLVSVNDRPAADAGSGGVICLGGAPITIGSEATGGRGPYAYRWEPAQGLSTPTDARPRARPDSTTRYRVIVTDANGCRDTSEVTVTVEERTLEFAGADPGPVYLEPSSHAAGCDTVMVRNRTVAAVVLEAGSLAVNVAFSLPPGQFPITIPPGESRPVIVCFDPDSSGVRRDTLLCVTRVCAYHVALTGTRLNEPLEGEAACSTTVRFRPDSASVLVRLRGVRPNPASDHARVQLEIAGDAAPVISATLVDVSGRSLGSFSADIVEVRAEGITPVVTAVIDLPVRDLPAGTYIVNVVASGSRFSLPLTITQ